MSEHLSDTSISRSGIVSKNTGSLVSASDGETSSVHSSVTASSTYRRHAGGSFVQPKTESPPKPVLSKDINHKPKTTGSLGILVVGLGGANGCTLTAGILANRLGIKWHGPRGEQMQPNWYGCITQLNKKGGGVGFKNKLRGLADAGLAAIGGWDIRPTKLGDALLRDQILDYDLVRQLREEMNQIKVFRGVYDERFIGTSQHSTATHILTKNEALNASEALKCLRADIRYFKWRNGVVGHTTVIWSACVEPNSEFICRLKTATDLLEAIDMTEQERGDPLPPSLLYATAAVLEGCSFINGGSQNTISCPGLLDLAKQHPGVYCLGTDFKAGQTKFKTAAVEYLRAAGFVPRVIASSNHLGNNDMRNLASSDVAASAKLRVKHDIFASWQEFELDHKVSIMYTPFINDDKRDVVEYTSLGFLGQTHTMVTYTRASDSVLCVPLMIDGAVWCDFFASSSWPFIKVSKALAYLFKVPEGAAVDMDPGFFKQMQELELQVTAVNVSKTGGIGQMHSIKRHVRIRSIEKTPEWAIPYDASIICAGLACVDMQLYRATGGGTGENIETFEGEKSIGGGSVSMACKTLARLCHGAPLDEEAYMQVTPPVVHSIVPLCMVGMDATGDKLISLLEQCGAACRNVETKYIKAARPRDPTARTALAVLPIYSDGRRGCFFDAASNVSFSAREMVDLISTLSPSTACLLPNASFMSSENCVADLEQMAPIFGAFIFGYPHLLPNMQGTALAKILLEARSTMIEGGIVAVDLNGVPDTHLKRDGDLCSANDLKRDPVLGAALEHVDILHMNEDELRLLTGCAIRGTAESDLEDVYNIAIAVNLFLICGVAVVIVTRGSKGCYVSCNDANRFRRTQALPASWVNRTCQVGCVELPTNVILNGNGAGDSFTAGFVVAAMLRHNDVTSLSKPKKTFDRASTPYVADQTRPTNSQRMKITPYNLYMRDKYVTLKTKLSNDKKAVFSKCHEMWESETENVKLLYEKKAMEENDKGSSDEMPTDDAESLSDAAKDFAESYDVASSNNIRMKNCSLNLESAAQFASLVAAYHVDTTTRDRLHIDIAPLLEHAMLVSKNIEGI